MSENVAATLATAHGHVHVRPDGSCAQGAGQVHLLPLHVVEVLHVRLLARHAHRISRVLLHSGRVHVPEVGERKRTTGTYGWLGGR